MNFPNLDNPASVRAAIQTSYDAYASNQDRFPRMRLRFPYDDLPYKSQYAARLLEAAWEGIDRDWSRFIDRVEAATESLGTDIETRPSIIRQVGRNAIYLATIADAGQVPRLTVVEYDATDFLRGQNEPNSVPTEGREMTVSLDDLISLDYVGAGVTEWA